jgi:hypothetical protein
VSANPGMENSDGAAQTRTHGRSGYLGKSQRGRLHAAIKLELTLVQMELYMTVRTEDVFCFYISALHFTVDKSP